MRGRRCAAGAGGGGLLSSSAAPASRRAARSASSAVCMLPAGRRAAARREPGGWQQGMIPAPPSRRAAPQAAGPVAGGVGRGGLVGKALGAAGGSGCCRHAPAECAPRSVACRWPQRRRRAARGMARLEPCAGQGGAAQWRDGEARARKTGARRGSGWPAKELLRAHRPFHHMGTHLSGARACLAGALGSHSRPAASPTEVCTAPDARCWAPFQARRRPSPAVAG
jgi:hypothetical protein